MKRPPNCSVIISSTSRSSEVYDTVLIPALGLAEKHWQLGELTMANTSSSWKA